MFFLNRHADHGKPLDPADQDTFGPQAVRQAEAHARARPGYAETPLVSLDALAREQGVAGLLLKDESTRFGLGSFKALGGAYAVTRLVLEAGSQALKRPLDVDDLRDPAVQVVARGVVVACATDGNHGRSVAQGAQWVGAKAVIFVHAGVSQARIDAIAAFGAEIVRVDGNYDDSVERAAAVSQERGWTVLSDTSWPGYERIPAMVMQGYTTLLAEAGRRMPTPPTHVFVQAGVGGIAAAAAAWFSLAHGARRPRFVVVEPARAACLYDSARAGVRTRIAAGDPTVMAMLECYEPSLVAWRILTRAADAYLTVDDDQAVAAMRRLADPLPGDPAIVAGESGAAGLAGFLAAAQDTGMRAALGIDAQSRILAINTEGATDPALYARLVGRTPRQVLAGRRPPSQA
ncbi:diaminopropionate ammonia-lyase [Bordetella genomosp. 13]|uniref:diaminopropionate ammonia-lyase n=1 Tax=Bordetella genomosp. 13 TaxID=463040 RepID=UPI0011A0194E|nr:diaminopropionate ammonia-lyase [Bordetella genomosp. 13]